MKDNGSVFSFNILPIYFIFSVFYILIAWLTNNWIFNDGLYYSTFGNQFSSQSIQAFLEFNNKIQWAGYCLIPIFILLKWLILATILYAGLFLYNQSTSFKDCFQICIIAEFCMLFAAVIKLIVFLLHKPSSVEEIQYFFPLSVLQFFSAKQIPPLLVYPLQQTNLFEICYWLVLIFGINAKTKLSFMKSFKVVASSYGISLFIVILFVIFLQLQFS
jgi:hypothetical protein